MSRPVFHLGPSGGLATLSWSHIHLVSRIMFDSSTVDYAGHDRSFKLPANCPRIFVHRVHMKAAHALTVANEHQDPLRRWVQD